jgi:tryptophanyl-tRNA synthetase
MRVLATRHFLSQTRPNVLLTGIQPTGELHIGNYLGSVINMLKYQEDNTYQRKYLMIADYHSLTTATIYEHSKISFNNSIGKDTLEMAKVLLASGVDPDKMCLFVQSQVPAHCELTWILSCLGPQHWLNTMIQYK